MTDLASLQVKVDASTADAAAKQLDKLAASGAKAEVATDKLGRAHVKAASDAGKQRLAELALESAIEKEIMAIQKSEMAMKAKAIAAERLGKTQQQVNAVTGQTRAGMTQLSYQIGDVSQQFAMGVRPMTIFAQQGGQVIQAIQLMTGGASKLGAFLMGPWGIAITAAAVVLTPFIGKLFETKTALNEVEQAAKDSLAAFYDSIDKSSSLEKAVSDQFARNIAATKEITRLEKERRAATASAAAAAGDPYGGQGYWFSQRAGIDRDIAAQRAIIADARAQVTAAINAQSDADKFTARANKPSGGSSSGGGGSSGGSRVERISDEARALQDATKAANDYIAALGLETQRIGKNAEELKRMEIATNAAAAPTVALATAIRLTGEETIKATNAAAALEAETKRLADATKARAEAQKDVNEAFKKEWEDEQAEALKRTREEAELLNNQFRDMIWLLDNIGGVGKGVSAALGFLTGNYGDIRGALGAFLSMTTGSRKDEKTGEIIAVHMGDELRKIFKVDGEFGKMLSGALQSAGVGMAAGQLVAGKNNTTTEQVGAALGGLLGTPFGPLGQAIGGMIGTIAGGLVSKIFKETKPSIPGIIAGAALFGLPGAILGGLLFGKAKYGTSAVSNDGIETFGNSKKYKASSLSAAEGVQGALAQLAAALGADIGSYSVSLGQYKGDWRVSGSGMTGKLKGGDAQSFGKEGAEAALRFAISDAIRDGALIGLRPSAQNLLAGSGDIETQVQKALAFNAVFDQLAESADPVKFQLDAIGKEFAKLEAIFREANATTEEMAQLQELRSKREAEIAKEAGREYREAAENLRAFRATLFEGAGGPVSLNARLAKFIAVGSLAASGDKDAMGNLPETASAYLAAARDNARTITDYQRAVATVARYTDKAILTADSMAGVAERQLQAMQNIETNTALANDRLASLETQSQQQTSELVAMKAWWNRMSPDGLSLAIVTREGDTIAAEVAA